MLRFLVLALTALFLSACSGGTFYIPKKTYQQQVKTLGVLPLLVDAQSIVVNPQGDEILDLLRRHNVGKEERLVEMLRASKAYFDIRPVAGDPAQLYRQLVTGGELAGTGETLHRRYHFEPAASSKAASDAVVDGLLVVILSGLEKEEVRRDRALVDYLKTGYSSIQASAYVIMPNGEVVWEYPGDGSELFMYLQYPDFDEAYYNKTDVVRLKNISLSGLDRTLSEQQSSVFSSSEFPKPYQDLFTDLTSALKPGLIPGF